MPNPGDWRDGKIHQFIMPGDRPWFGDINGELLSFKVHTANFASGGSSVETSVLATA
jgi:hypothetical protein